MRTLKQSVCGVACAALVAVCAQPAAADPPTRSCGSLPRSGQTLRLRAAGLSCKTARRLLRAPTNSRGEVRSNHQYVYTASDCEGILWRKRDLAYSQAHDGKLPADARFVRYVVTRGCAG
jgi:hypothetical protein